MQNYRDQNASSQLENFGKALPRMPDRHEAGKPSAEEGKDKKKTLPLWFIYEYAQDLSLFVGEEDRQAYVTVSPEGKPDRTYRVFSEEFEGELRLRYLKENGRPVSKGEVQTVLLSIGARAKAHASVKKVYKRIGSKVHPETNVLLELYVNLGNGSVAVINKDGWKITNSPPVKFVHTSSMLPLPTPVRGGKIDDIWRFVHIESSRDRALYLGWIFSSFHFAGPYPILQILGSHGALKTTAARFACNMVDPQVSVDSKKAREVRDLAVRAKNNHVTVQDNVSSLSGDLSDLMCLISTGGAISERQYLTNSDSHNYKVKGPQIVTAITQVITRADAADRSSTISLPIYRGKRRREDELGAEFAKAWPSLFGAVLDVLVAIVKNLPTTTLDYVPRMADTAYWVTAAEEFLGWERGYYVSIYAEAMANQQESIVEGDLFVIYLMGFMEGKDFWAGNAKTLLQELQQSHSWNEKDFKLPHSPQAVKSFLQRLEANLPGVGLAVQLPGMAPYRIPEVEGSDRWIVIRRIKEEK